MSPWPWPASPEVVGLSSTLAYCHGHPFRAALFKVENQLGQKYCPSNGVTGKIQLRAMSTWGNVFTSPYYVGERLGDQIPPTKCFKYWLFRGSPGHSIQDWHLLLPIQLGQKIRLSGKLIKFQVNRSRLSSIAKLTRSRPQSLRSNTGILAPFSDLTLRSGDILTNDRIERWNYC